MKTPVTITMLVVGGFLLIAPFAFSAIQQQQVAAILIARSDLTSLNFSGEHTALSPLSRFGCWFTGSILCAFAIIGAIKDTRRSAQTPDL